jgi:hypothetical protein
MEIHAHDIVTFTRCRRRDWYGRVRGIDVPTVGRNAELGSMIHAALTALVLGKDSRAAIENYAVEAAPRGVLITEEDKNLAADVAAFTFRHFFDELPPREILSAEQEYSLKIANTTITMRPDLVYRENGIHLVDYKTKDALPSDYTWFDLDPQMLVYNVGIHERYPDENVFVEHLLIRREVPPGYGHRPEYNEGIDKNGRPYRRKSTASTDPSDYYRLFSFQVNAQTVAAYRAELERIVVEMEKEADLRGPIRSASMLCPSCPFFAICRRDQAGETVSDAEAKKYFSLVAGGV